MKKMLIDKIIRNALKEDMNNGDITSETLLDSNTEISGNLIAKEDGIIAGVGVFTRTFKIVDEGINIEWLIEEGQRVSKGEKIAEVKGIAANVLMAERTALNILQRMSGIATLTSTFVEEANNPKVRIVDTRKTVPGLRVLDKYSVRIGGGHNHRFNLSDAVMIKDNHIIAMGGISKAVEKARAEIPHTMKIEVEVEDFDQLKEALDAGADIIMLDNMDVEKIKESVKINNGRAILEVSGNVSIENIREIAETGIDVISVGALTHSVRAFDISLKM